MGVLRKSVFLDKCLEQKKSDWERILLVSKETGEKIRSLTEEEKEKLS